MRAAFEPAVGVEWPHRMTPRYRWRLREGLHKILVSKDEKNTENQYTTDALT